MQKASHVSTPTSTNRPLKDKAVDMRAHSVFFAAIIALVFYSNHDTKWVLQIPVAILCYGGWTATLVTFIVGAVRSYRLKRLDKASPTEQS